MDEHEEVWVENLPDIFKRLVLLPSRGDSFAAKVNALTRLLVVVVVILAVLKWRHWPTVLATGLFLILFLYLLKEGKTEIEHFDEDMSNLKHYATPLDTLYVQGKCETEIVQPVTEVIPQSEVQAAPRPGKIRVATRGTKKGTNAYDEYQASFDFERKRGTPNPDYSGLTGLL